MGWANGPLYICPNCRVGKEDKQSFINVSKFDCSFVPDEHSYIVCSKCGYIATGVMKLMIEVATVVINKKAAKEFLKDSNEEKLDEVLNTRGSSKCTIIDVRGINHPR